MSQDFDSATPGIQWYIELDLFFPKATANQQLNYLVVLNEYYGVTGLIGINVSGKESQSLSVINLFRLVVFK